MFCCGIGVHEKNLIYVEMERLRIYWRRERIGKRTFEFTYYIRLIGKVFSLSIYRRQDNKKRWREYRLLIMAMKSGNVFGPDDSADPSKLLPYFELEDDKIKFDIPCPK